jgi:hypothetical protein
MIIGDYQKRTLKAVETLVDLKLLQYLATGQSDRQTVTTVAHIHEILRPAKFSLIDATRLVHIYGSAIGIFILTDKEFDYKEFAYRVSSAKILKRLFHSGARL